MSTPSTPAIDMTGPLPDGATGPTIGPADVVTALKTYLTGVFPEVLAGARLAFDLTLDVLPDPGLITAAELGSIPDYRQTPALLIAPERLVSLTPRPGGTVADALYQVAVEGYVRGGQPEPTADLNRRYAALTRQALLSHQTRPAATYGLRIDPASMAEEYFPVFQEQSGRWISGFRSTARVRRAESLAWAPTALGGQVGDITVTTALVGPDQPMPKHPAL